MLLIIYADSKRFQTIVFSINPATVFKRNIRNKDVTLGFFHNIASHLRFFWNKSKNILKKVGKYDTLMM